MIEQIPNLQKLVNDLENKLATSEARFQSITQYNMDGLLIVDREGKIRFANPAAERILCRPIEKLIGETLGFPVLAGETIEIDLLCPGGQIKTAEMRVGNTTWNGPAFLISLRDTTERKQAEAQIRFQAQLLNSVGQAVFATDLKGRITYWNHAAEMLYGWSAQEVLGNHIIDIVLSNYTQAQATEIMAALQQGNRWSGEFIVRHRDGHTFPILVTNTPLYDEHNTPVGIVIISTDISERKQAELILHVQRDLGMALASTANLQDAANLILDNLLKLEELDCGGLYLVDRAGGALNLLAHRGLSAALVERIANYSPDSPQAKLAYAGKPIYGEYSSIIHPTGDPIREQEGLRATAIVPITGPNGVIAVLNVASHTGDRISQTTAHTLETITALLGQVIGRLEAEAVSREKTTELDRFFSYALDLLCIANIDGHFERLNPEWEKTLGYPLSELEGRSFFDLVHPDDLPTTRTALQQLKEQQSIVSFTNRYRCRDGSYRWIEWRAHPVGQKVFAAAHDITERQKNQEQILHLNNILRAIRNINQLITREKDADRLLNGVCNCLVETRGYRSAWIARFDSSGQFHSFTSSGNDTSLACLDELMRNGYVPLCVQHALKTAEIIILDTCPDCPGNSAPEHVYKMSVRLAYNEQIYGVMTVALFNPIDRSEIYNEEEKSLFLEVAGDLAFALHSIELEQQRALTQNSLRQALEQLQEREKQLQAALREKETMLAEIHHRVKNNLQVIAGLLEFQSQYIQDAQAIEALQSCRDRIYTMSLVHEQLYRSTELTRIDAQAYIDSMINDLLTAYRRPDLPIEVDIQIDRFYLNIRQAIPCGMLINELVSNALKHAFPFPHPEKATIGVYISINALNICTLTVSDNGVGLPADFRFRSGETLGMFLIDTLVKQLKGTITWQSQGGTTCHIEFALLTDDKEPQEG